MGTYDNQRRPETSELDGSKRRYELDNGADRASYGVANSAARDQAYEAQKQGYAGRATPGTNFADALASRGAQNDALALQRGAANGTAPSAAQAQFAQALGASQQQQASIAASARGGGLQRGAANRMAAQNAAATTQNAAAGAASLRAQEMSDARAAYGGLASNIRGQDASQAQFLTQADLQSRALNDQMVNAYEGQRTGLATQNFQGELARQQAKETAYQQGVQKYGADQGVSVAQQQQANQTAATVASTVGTVGMIGASMFSDERVKTDVHDGGSKAQSFLDALNAADYKYKNPGEPGMPEGRHTSVMAQDLEKSELGRRMVHDTPEGKVVDYREGFASMLAGMAKMNGDVDRLKSALASRKRAA